jgi:hypothetical protein
VGLAAPTPAAAAFEDVAGRWLAELLGLPAGVSFALVTGCQMAHVTALAAARHRVLADAGHDVERDGLAGAPAIRVLAGEARPVDRSVEAIAAAASLRSDDGGSGPPGGARRAREQPA